MGKRRHFHRKKIAEDAAFASERSLSSVRHVTKKTHGRGNYCGALPKIAETPRISPGI
jgi:hypothetical protein